MPKGARIAVQVQGDQSAEQGHRPVRRQIGHRQRLGGRVDGAHCEGDQESRSRVPPGPDHASRHNGMLWRGAVANTAAKASDTDRRPATCMESEPRSWTPVDDPGQPARAYGSEGWGFESLRARQVPGLSPPGHGLLATGFANSSHQTAPCACTGVIPRSRCHRTGVRCGVRRRTTPRCR